MSDEDRRLRRVVLDELRWSPILGAEPIEAMAEDGVVTLSGRVSCYGRKLLAERSVARLRGVKAIAQDIEVCLPGDARLSDGEIADRARCCLAWDVTMAAQPVGAEVRHGWVTLRGQVAWHFQRMAAERIIGRLQGIIGLTNEIGLRDHPQAADLHEAIRAALLRQNRLDAAGIVVTARAGHVTLSGRVGSLPERATALRVAWLAPGVREVTDRLLVD